MCERRRATEHGPRLPDPLDRNAHGQWTRSFSTSTIAPAALMPSMIGDASSCSCCATWCRRRCRPGGRPCRSPLSRYIWRIFAGVRCGQMPRVVRRDHVGSAARASGYAILVLSEGGRRHQDVRVVVAARVLKGSDEYWVASTHRSNRADEARCWAGRRARWC